jgi:serine/threonine protein kinase
MPRAATVDFDANAPPFDQLKGIQLLTRDRRGHVSVENARHHLYVGRDKASHTNALIKITSRPGLIYQENLKNEIASLTTVNRSLPDSRYFPVIKAHGTVDDGRVYIIASFFDEFPLATAIGNERIPGKTVSYIRTVMEIANAMTELHGLKIYHVDLNPMNILLREEHATPTIRIIDFESSFESARHSAGAFYNPPHTPGYSAPEIGRQAPDGRSDTFSLGAVLYTMLAGYTWTWAADVGKCVAADQEVHPDLKSILLRAVDANPENRYPTIDEFRAGLEGHLERIWPARKVLGPW